MTRPPRRLLTDAEKDALLDRQAVLIDALMARIAALEAALAKPRKTSRNSHIPPSQDRGGGSSGDRDEAKPKKRRPSRPGVSRRLAAAPDETIVCRADRCACGADVSGLNQTCRQRYDHVDIPPVLPNVTRVELHGGRIEAESDGPGKGATFRVTLPLAASAEGQRRPGHGATKDLDSALRAA
jgi:transposase